jgi:hypothetical protein
MSGYLTMPETFMQEIVSGVSWWIHSVSKLTSLHEQVMLNLCRRVLAMPLEAGPNTTRNTGANAQPVSDALNHPVGHVTQALINLWFRRNPNDNDHLPVDIEPLFTELCDVNVDRFRHGRVLLGSRLIALYRVDPKWTQQYLLPLLSWKNPEEAKAIWEDFLWSPRLYQPLLIAFKPHFLESAKHYTELGKHRQQFAAFLTYAALGSIEGYSDDELRTAINALPQAGLEECAQALAQSLEGASDQREEYWKHRIRPFWQHLWPKSRELATPKIAESLTRMTIAAGSEFPAALTDVRAWLKAIEYPYYVIHLLHDSGLCNRFPSDALWLLNAVIDGKQRVPEELEQCLDQIEQAAPQFVQDAQYKRLRLLTQIGRLG